MYPEWPAAPVLVAVPDDSGGPGVQGSITFADALADAPPTSAAGITGDDRYILYTGGTTGVSKGAMLSHRNIVRNVQQIVLWQDDVYDDLPSLVAIAALGGCQGDSRLAEYELAGPVMGTSFSVKLV